MKKLDDLVERDKPVIDKNVRVMSNYKANIFFFFEKILPLWETTFNLIAIITGLVVIICSMAADSLVTN